MKDKGIPHPMITVPVVHTIRTAGGSFFELWQIKYRYGISHTAMMLGSHIYHSPPTGTQGNRIPHRQLWGDGGLWVTVRGAAVASCHLAKNKSIQRAAHLLVEAFQRKEWELNTSILRFDM